MKAVLQTQYGPPEVLKLQEVEKPAPKEHQVLIKVHASSINALEWRTLRARPYVIRPMIGGLLKPKDPRTGTDVAGIVEAVGEAVTQFKPGDAVFGCAKGAFAEYALARDKKITFKPAGCSFEEAAALPVAGLTALQGLRNAGGIRPGQKVLIQGASGGVGMFAVQLARWFGAEVTAVCSPRNLEMARSVGADYVIDYTREDFTHNQACYDLIFGVNGYHSLFAYRRALKPQGIYVCAGGTLPQVFEAMLLGSLLSKKGGKKLCNMGVAEIIQEDLTDLGQLLETGKLVPIIDQRYPLSEVVEAMRYVEEQHPQGKVIITVS